MTGVQLAPVLSQSWVIGLPKFALLGLLSISIGEFVCRLLFQAAPPCTVRPVMSRATSEVSRPLMRKS